MVVSMTGFGRSKKSLNQFSALVEIKSVNHRFSEYQIRMPRQLFHLEDKIKKKLGESIHRGRIEVYVTVEGDQLATRQVQVDWTLLDEYYQYITKIKDRFAIDQGLTVHDFIRDELISIEEKDAGNEEIERVVLAAIEEASEHLLHMRKLEGTELEKDLKLYLNEVAERINHLKELAPKVVQQYQERLTKRMSLFLEGQLDEARILTEVALFADKADISEELTRLLSHLNQFESTLQVNERVGRKLDFLIQEMNREVNTIGSKANDASIASEVVELKSCLEKMKEQVQNIE
ncbi:YicC/YloC family endoribonuclease [Cytobacillus praedii]|uniref:YicC family protein n=1 Tax=Cytobacillus praedii TaxID=1742358 RepID=A0A4R1B4L8_9BACI|nr:YicC/YloC family endoribonuclease [Cytobacillus praedii]MED3552247.1 YicC family protein [Cytobacillus praedii]TCJ06041.1 YicC family protein [Cytobacillus praedii]